MTTSKGSFRTLGTCGVAALMLGAGAWWNQGTWNPFHWPSAWHNPRWVRWYYPPTPPPVPAPIACTQDAMQCPDGSYVGRMPPSCAFKACPAGRESGIVSGTVSIGPLCPVEPCPAGRPNPYLGRTMIFSPQSSSLPPAYAPLASDGTFRTALRAGTYAATLSPCTELGCRAALPRTVIVPEHGEARLTVDIDTGIR